MSPEKQPPDFNQELDKIPEKPQHECGVVGVYAPKADVARLTFYALYRLQHRGQESAGIATMSEGGIKVVRRMGLVREAFREEDIAELCGFAAIGHTRYSNTGGSNIANAQPAIYGEVAISENGNLQNSAELRAELDSRGIFASVTPEGTKCSSDGELIAQTIATSAGGTHVEKIIDACKKFVGAYTLTILAGENLFAVRDPKGFWPLVLGSLDGNGFAIASESTSLDIIGATFLREIEPGEILLINSSGIASFHLPSDGKTAVCPFDWNYFRRPDSLITPDVYAYQFRFKLGQQLAIEKPVVADVVIGEKDSGTYAAHGFAEQSGICFSEGEIKDPYSRRIFIEPDPRVRDAATNLKHSILKPEVAGRKVAVVTDSLVRGQQSKGLVGLLRKMGACQVHYRSTFPKISDPCHFGIDTYAKWELIGSGKTEEEVASEIGADSVGYLSPEGMELVISEVANGKNLSHFCRGCYLGEYPIPVSGKVRDKLVLENR